MSSVNSGARFTLALSAAVVVLAPTLASAQEVPQVTGVRLERAEQEVRAIVAIEPADAAPAHRLMRDDRSLRLLLVDTTTESSDTEVEDQTLHRIRVRRHGGRSVVRLDPHASPIGVLERAEVRPHPQGLVVVVTRSDREAEAWREAARPPERQQAEGATDEETDEGGEEAAAAAAAVDTAASDGAPRAGGSSSAEPSRGSTTSTPAPEGGDDGSATPIRAAAAAGALVLLGMAALYYRRRRGKGAAAGARSIDVVSAKRLGARQSLLLVEVDGQSFLIGVSDKGMVRLAELGDPDMAAAFGNQLEEAITTEPMAPRHEREPAAIPAPVHAAPAIDDGPTLDAVEGLMRLKRLAGSTAPGHNGKTNGTAIGRADGNGRELSLAGLESLLQNRAAN